VTRRDTGRGQHDRAIGTAADPRRAIGQINRCVFTAWKDKFH
jgi:hypothetical protein